MKESGVSTVTRVSIGDAVGRYIDKEEGVNDDLLLAPCGRQHIPHAARS
jgi:hypothetical protein